VADAGDGRGPGLGNSVNCGDLRIERLGRANVRRLVAPAGLIVAVGVFRQLTSVDSIHAYNEDFTRRFILVDNICVTGERHPVAIGGKLAPCELFPK